MSKTANTLTRDGHHIRGAERSKGVPLAGKRFMIWGAMGSAMLFFGVWTFFPLLYVFPKLLSLAAARRGTGVPGVEQL